MNPTCVLVADFAHARLLSVRPEANPLRFERQPLRVREHDGLLNPERKMKEHELFSSPRSDSVGRNQGRVYTIDDRRARQEEEHDKRFAARVLEAGEHLAHELGADQLVLVAEPNMLGVLRAALAHRTASKLKVAEVPKDLIKLAPHEICEHLVNDRVLWAA